MENIKDLVKKITGKDEQTALDVTRKMIDDGNSELFKELINQSDYLFPFVKENVLKRLEKSVCKSNFENLYKFLDYYSPDYDKIFSMAFKYFGEDSAKTKMLEYFRNGSVAQKTYAAKYFGFAKDISGLRELIENAFSDDDYLAEACANSLGIFNEQKSYSIALAKLNSGDDFEALLGLNFFVAYAKNPPMKDIFQLLKNSGMAENVAGKIAYLKPLPNLLQEDLPNVLFVIDNILNGFGEILPLSEVFNFELYNVIGMLSQIEDTDYISRIAVILLKAKNKIDMICGNDEYTFDEDKNTKAELKDIQSLLNSFGEDFWRQMKEIIPQELEKDEKRIMSALGVIRENNINSAVPQILEMIYENENETLLCEAFATLKQLGALSYITKEDAVSRFNNENLKTIVESYYL